MVLRTLLVWAAGLPATLALFIVVLAVRPFDRSGNLIHSLGGFWARFLLFLSGVKVAVNGGENIPPGPVILLCNHQSAFDILALQGKVPVQFRWVAKKSLFNIPVLGWAMRLAGYIGIDRENAKAAYRSMVAAALKIKEGTSVLIFPEGTRSESADILPFKRGAFVLAARSGVPLVPMAISGTAGAMKKGSLLIAPARAVISIGPPIESRGLDENALMKRAQEVIEGLYGKELVKNGKL